jgi:hypothetical protein
MLSGGQKRSARYPQLASLSMVIRKLRFLRSRPLAWHGSVLSPRRSTWHIIQRNKKGGVILMATHFMDQAALSLLGDRIALMAEDSGVAMLGSSLF